MQIPKCVGAFGLLLLCTGAVSGILLYSPAVTTQEQITKNEAWMRQMVSCKQVYKENIHSLPSTAYFKPPFASAPFDSDGNSISCEFKPGEP